jgi:hypothetical protein
VFEEFESLSAMLYKSKERVEWVAKRAKFRQPTPDQLTFYNLDPVALTPPVKIT